jgi:hypothetical protein
MALIAARDAIYKEEIVRMTMMKPGLKQTKQGVRDLNYYGPRRQRFAPGDPTLEKGDADGTATPTGTKEQPARDAPLARVAVFRQ